MWLLLQFIKELECCKNSTLGILTTLINLQSWFKLQSEKTKKLSRMRFQMRIVVLQETIKQDIQSLMFKERLNQGVQGEAAIILTLMI
jgi:hypothetical protein